MINLTASLTYPNTNRWEVRAFDINGGRVTLRFWAPSNTLPTPPWVDVDCFLSNTANRGTGVALNSAPEHRDDKIISVGPRGAVPGVGATNAFTNAQNAYRAAANHNAGLRAIEGTMMTDGYIGAGLGGT